MGGLKIEEEETKEEKRKERIIREITPVDRAYHESLILRDRWNVGKLYANNIFQGQNHRREVRNMAHHRANKLYGIDQEIDDMKRRIENIIIQKDSLKYLPTEKEYAQMQLAKEKKKQRVRVVPDPRHQSVIILPPIYKTVPGRGANKSKEKKTKKQLTNKTNKKRKPLHAPKHMKTKITETPRQRRYKKEYVEHDTPLMTSASMSVISSYPESVRTYYPSSVATGELLSIRESPFKYGSLYGKSSFKIHPDSNSYAEDDNKKSSYNKRFYQEKDFKSTKAKYIPKNMRSSNGYNHNFLTL